MTKVRERRSGSSRIPQGVKFRHRPISGAIMTLVPMDSTILSIVSISTEFGNNAAIRVYPGMKRISGTARINRINDWFITGVYILIIHRAVQIRTVFISHGNPDMSSQKDMAFFSRPGFVGSIIVNYRWEIFL